MQIFTIWLRDDRVTTAYKCRPWSIMYVPWILMIEIIIISTLSILSSLSLIYHVRTLDVEGWGYNMINDKSKFILFSRTNIWHSNVTNGSVCVKFRTIIFITTRNCYELLGYSYEQRQIYRDHQEILKTTGTFGVVKKNWHLCVCKKRGLCQILLNHMYLWPTWHVWPLGFFFLFQELKPLYAITPSATPHRHCNRSYKNVAGYREAKQTSGCESLAREKWRRRTKITIFNNKNSITNVIFSWYVTLKEMQTLWLAHFALLLLNVDPGYPARYKIGPWI